MKFNPETLQKGSAVFKHVMSSATPISNNFNTISYKPFIRRIVINLLAPEFYIRFKKITNLMQQFFSLLS